MIFSFFSFNPVIDCVILYALFKFGPLEYLPAPDHSLTLLAPADASNNIDKYTYPSENCKKLVDAIKAQNSEVIDLNEFTGICMSLKKDIFVLMEF